MAWTCVRTCSRNWPDEPNVVAIKEETYDTTRVTDLYARFGERFVVFCGVDDLIVESVALGVKGWVSGMANAMPKESVDLLNSRSTATTTRRARCIAR